jgi:hypothetical protein
MSLDEGDQVLELAFLGNFDRFLGSPSPGRSGFGAAGDESSTWWA